MRATRAELHVRFDEWVKGGHLSKFERTSVNKCGVLSCRIFARALTAISYVEG